eukprot:4330641-Pyramimonas_sp.AAC.1
MVRRCADVQCPDVQNSSTFGRHVFARRGFGADKTFRDTFQQAKVSLLAKGLTVNTINIKLLVLHLLGRSGLYS